MYETLTHDVAGSPEIRLSSNRQLVEIGRYTPAKAEVLRCFRYHSLIAWMAPEKARVKAAVSGAPRTIFHSVDDVLFVPAGTSLAARHEPDAGTHRVLIMSLPDEAPLSEEILSYAREQLAMGVGIRDIRIRQFLLQVAHEASAPGFGSDMLLGALSSAISVHLARALRQDRRRGGLTPWQLRLIMDRLQLPSDRPLPNLTELAALVDISPRHLRRAFKESTGLSIGEQIDSNRLQLASTLLCETDQAIKEIAWRLGFSDQYSFTVAFKRRTGETPSAFRRRLQQTGAPRSLQ